MNRLGATVRLMLRLPQVWIAIAATGAAVLANGWEPFVDIAAYAVWRLLR